MRGNNQFVHLNSLLWKRNIFKNKIKVMYYSMQRARTNKAESISTKLVKSVERFRGKFFI